MKYSRHNFIRKCIPYYLLLFLVFSHIPNASAQQLPESDKNVIKLAQLPTENQPNLSNISYSGPEESIKQFLCTPSDNNLGVALYECVAKLYRFGIAAGALTLVFFIVLAGYFYLSGGETSKAKGKSIITAALVGMSILLLSYVLLRFINPNLAQFRTVQPPIFNASLPSCEEIGYGENCMITSGASQGQVFYGGGGGTCSMAPSGSPGSVESLTNSCFGKFGAEVVKHASIVAMRESNGNPALPVGAKACPGNRVARCAGGEIPVWGLFQINITVHKVNGLDCPKAFSNGWTCSKGCTVVNPDLYNKCVSAVKNPQYNTAVACDIYSSSINARKPGFQQWGNDASGNEHGKKCGF